MRTPDRAPALCAADAAIERARAASQRGQAAQAGAQAGAPAGVQAGGVHPDELVAMAMAELERPIHGPPHQPPALFTLSGVRVTSADLLARVADEGGGLVLMEGIFRELSFAALPFLQPL